MEFLNGYEQFLYWKWKKMLFEMMRKMMKMVEMEEDFLHYPLNPSFLIFLSFVLPSPCEGLELSLATLVFPSS